MENASSLSVCNDIGITVRCVTCTNVSPPSLESTDIKGPFTKV